MTSEATQTRGLQLVRMGLVRSFFESAQPLILDPAHQRALEAKFGGRPTLALTVAHRHELGAEPGQVGVFLQVEALVQAKSEVLATMQAEFVAFYIMGHECEITQQQLVDTFAPAHLYAFCREHIADLARRACGYVILPPAHFKSVEQQQAGPGAASTVDRVPKSSG